jgi:hypothetical protein
MFTHKVVTILAKPTIPEGDTVSSDKRLRWLVSLSVGEWKFADDIVLQDPQE